MLNLTRHLLILLEVVCLYGIVVTPVSFCYCDFSLGFRTKFYCSHSAWKSFVDARLLDLDLSTYDASLWYECRDKSILLQWVMMRTLLPWYMLGQENTNYFILLTATYMTGLGWDKQVFLYKYSMWTQHLSHQSLMVGTETVHEMSDTNSTFIWLILWEDFIVYCHCENLKSMYKCVLSFVFLPFDYQENGGLTKCCNTNINDHYNALQQAP